MTNKVLGTCIDTCLGLCTEMHVDMRVCIDMCTNIRTKMLKAVKKFGVELAIDMCKALHETGVPGFYFYTLNLEFSIIKACGMHMACASSPLTVDWLLTGC